MWRAKLLSGVTWVVVVSVVGVGCAAEPSRGAAGQVAQAIEGDEGDGGAPPVSADEPPVAADEPLLTADDLAEIAAGNAAVAASIDALDDLASPAVTCAMASTCDAGEPGPGDAPEPVGEPGPVSEPEPVGEPGPVGAQRLFADAAVVLEADVVCGPEVNTAATIAGLLAGIQAMEALLGDARVALRKAQERLRLELQDGSLDRQEAAKIEVINAQTRVTVLEIQKGRLLPALAALLADPCSLASKRAVAQANVDIAQATYKAAQEIRAILNTKHLRKKAARAKYPRDIPQSLVDDAKQALDAALANEQAAKAAYDAAVAVLAALPAP